MGGMTPGMQQAVMLGAQDAHAKKAIRFMVALECYKLMLDCPEYVTNDDGTHTLLDGKETAELAWQAADLFIAAGKQ